MKVTMMSILSQKNWFLVSQPEGLEDKSRSRRGLMFRRVENSKPGHTNLFI